MNKLIDFVNSIIIILFSKKIKPSIKIYFLFYYFLAISQIILFKKKTKNIRFLNGKNFFYSGSHLNLLLDNIALHLKYYSPYYSDAKNVIDVGASFGTFSLMINYLNPQASIYTFEPSKESFSLLEKNCQKIKKLEIINKAVGASKAKVNFFDNIGFPEGSQVQRNSKNSSYVIGQIPLDEFTKSKKLKKISLLKIDTEGYEREVLAGAAYTLSITDCLIIETDIEKLNHLIDVLNYLKKYGFTLVNFGSINRNPIGKREIGSLDLIFKK